MSLLVLVAILAVIAGAFFAYRTIRMPQSSSTGTERPLDAQELEVRTSLIQDVMALASFGQRNALSLRGLTAAAAFVRSSMQQAGCTPQSQKFRVGHVDYENIFAIVPGSKRPDEIIVIGAHYDTVFDSPGADDNASGVAGMLAVMRAMRGHPPERTIHFVAFANEEPPFFRTRDMGSYHYAEALHAKKSRVIAMLSIESIGFYRKTPRSQLYPAPLDRFFPSTADFIAVVGNLSSRELAARCAGAFQRTGVAVEAAAMPSFIQEAAWSDHWSFWEFGVPAVMITDTALFRNANYHTPDDLPETLDYDQMTRVVTGLIAIARELGTGK